MKDIQLKSFTELSINEMYATNGGWICFPIKILLWQLWNRK